MTNHAHRVIEIVGTSPDSVDAAIRTGWPERQRRHADWTGSVQSVRGDLEDGAIAHFR
jgi:flavin-binding protein dodecin